jgi:hypothetical protein
MGVLRYSRLSQVLFLGHSLFLSQRLFMRGMTITGLEKR